MVLVAVVEHMRLVVVDRHMLNLVERHKLVVLVWQRPEEIVPPTLEVNGVLLEGLVAPYLAVGYLLPPV